MVSSHSAFHSTVYGVLSTLYGIRERDRIFFFFSNEMDGELVGVYLPTECGVKSGVYICWDVIWGGMLC